MKIKLFLFILPLAVVMVKSQVGIGVPNPTQALEVDGGDIYINDKFYMGSLPSYDGHTLGPEKFRIVAVDKESESNGSPVDGRFMEFVGNQEIMPIIIQPYNVSSINKDNLSDLNLNISTSKYVISLCNFEAVPVNSSLGIYRISNSGGQNPDYVYDNFVIRTFESGGKWHLEIRARDADPQNGSYNYNFDIILFPKRFFRNLGDVVYNLGGSNSGAAAAPPAGI